MQSVIMVVNDDLPDAIVATMERQFFAHEVMTGAEFDARAAAVPSYPDEIKALQRRIIVMRPLTDNFDRTIVDLVLLVHLGLVYVEASKFGPPGFSCPLDRATLDRLLSGH